MIKTATRRAKATVSAIVAIMALGACPAYHSASVNLDIFGQNRQPVSLQALDRLRMGWTMNPVIARIT